MNKREFYGKYKIDVCLVLMPYEYAYVYPLSSEALADLAYFFENETNLNRQQKQEVEPTEKIITDRPELEMLQNCVNKWFRRWQSTYQENSQASALPILCMDDNGSCITIYDTRPCASDRLLLLEGLAYWVYKVCDRALTHRELVSAIRNEAGLDISWNDIQPLVAKLRESKILLEINGRLLSLAVKESCSPLPQLSELPAGYVDIQEFRRIQRQLNQPVLLPK